MYLTACQLSFFECFIEHQRGNLSKYQNTETLNYLKKDWHIGRLLINTAWVDPISEMLFLPFINQHQTPTSARAARTTRGHGRVINASHIVQATRCTTATTIRTFSWATWRTTWSTWSTRPTTKVTGPSSPRFLSVWFACLQWEQGCEKGANQVEDGPKSVRNNA